MFTFNTFHKISFISKVTSVFTCNTFHKISYNYKLYIAFHVKRVGKIRIKNVLSLL